jgi:hypothetical protein
MENGKTENTGHFRKWENQKYWPLPKMESPKIPENGNPKKLTASEKWKNR